MIDLQAFDDLVQKFELEIAITTLKILIADGKITNEDVCLAAERAGIELKKAECGRDHGE